MVSYPEAHPGPSQISNLELFGTKANGFKLMLCTAIAKSSMVDVERGAIYDRKFTVPE